MLTKQEILNKLDFRSYYQSELGNLGPAGGDGWTKNSRCPFHDEKNGSFGINLNDGRFKCFGCDAKGSLFDFHMKKHGGNFSTALKQLGNFAGVQSINNKKFHHFKLGNPVKIYPYHDQDGTILYNVCRFEPKEFRPCDPSGKWKVKGIKSVPYNLPALKKSNTVFLAEGEKDAGTLNKLGLVGTCQASWTGRWDKAFAEHFKGKTVYILQDADQAGKDKAQDAAQALSRVDGVKIKILPPFSDQKGFDITDWIQAGHTKNELLKIIVDSESQVQTSVEKSKFQLKRLSEIEFRPPEWLVNSLFEKDTLAMVFGDPGAAKSFFSIDIASCVATGKDFHGLEVKQGAVVYIAGEGQNGIKRRFMAWGIRHGYNNLDDAPIFVSLIPAALCDQEQAGWVIDAINQVSEECGEPSLIVFDTVARNFGPGDENSTKDMSGFIKGADIIREQCRACIFLVHHTGHGDKSRGRGAMALKGALDSEYRLDKDDHGVVRVVNTKMKDFQPPGPMAFKIRTVELGMTDEDGQKVTSAILDSTDYKPPAKVNKAGRGRWQAVALDTLERLNLEHRERLVRGGHDPATARVLVSDWRNNCSATGMSKQSWANCKKTLVTQGLVAIEQDYAKRTM